MAGRIEWLKRKKSVKNFEGPQVHNGYKIEHPKDVVKCAKWTPGASHLLNEFGVSAVCRRLMTLELWLWPSGARPSFTLIIDVPLSSSTLYSRGAECCECRGSQHRGADALDFRPMGSGVDFGGRRSRPTSCSFCCVKPSKWDRVFVQTRYWNDVIEDSMQRLAGNNWSD